MLSFEDVKQQVSIKGFCEEHLEKINNTYICPFCNSGKGNNHTPALKLYEETASFTCFSCNKSGDIYHLVGKIKNIENRIQQKGYIENWANIKSPSSFNSPKIQPKKKLQDYTEFIEKANKNNDYKYLLQRGISEKIQDKFNIGYVKDWVHPKAKNSPKTERCIIPRSKYSYLARAISANTPEQYQKQIVGTQNSLFNIKGAFYEPVIFIVEGEIDTLSLYEAGFTACGIGSTTNTDSFLNAVKANYKPDIDQRFILMLDNDESGQKAQSIIAEGLESLNLSYLEAKYKYNDPNEYLIKDKEGLIKNLQELKDKALKLEKKLNKNNVASLIKYFENIEEQEPELEAKTGFNCFDNENANLYGGIHEGIYFIGANSGLGKTTFCLQLASQISNFGNDVIFFSLEMSANELIAKGISKHTYIKHQDNTTEEGYFKAKDTMQILQGRKYKSYTDEELKTIKEALKQYKQEARNLYIYEGKLSIENIKEIVENHIKTTGNVPVIFIDYLQILKPPNDLLKGTDKQIVDNAVEALKEISRIYKTAIIAISSFNRENYNEPVSMKSFKESGAIEYSSDILLGLQLEGLDKEEGESQKEYNERIKEIKQTAKENKYNKKPVPIELKCLKNRNGYTFKQSFNFIHAFNYYTEKLTPEEESKYKDFIADWEQYRDTKDW